MPVRTGCEDIERRHARVAPAGDVAPVAAVRPQNRAQQQRDDLVARIDAMTDLLLADQDELAFASRYGVRRARKAVERRQLAEQLAGADHSQNLFHIAGTDRNLDLAALDDEGEIAQLAFMENLRAGRIDATKYAFAHGSAAVPGDRLFMVGL